MPVPVPTAAPPPPPRATATPVPTATAAAESSSSQSHPPDDSATPTALPTAAAPPPVASATPVPVPTAATSAQLRLLPRKPRAAARSTCRDRFMLMLLSARIDPLAPEPTGGCHACAADRRPPMRRGGSERKRVVLGKRVDLGGHQ